LQRLDRLVNCYNGRPLAWNKDSFSLDTSPVKLQGHSSELVAKTDHVARIWLFGHIRLTNWRGIKLFPHLYWRQLSGSIVGRYHFNFAHKVRLSRLRVSLLHNRILGGLELEVDLAAVWRYLGNKFLFLEFLANLQILVVRNYLLSKLIRILVQHFLHFRVEMFCRNCGIFFV